MNQKELKELIEFIEAHDIAEFELERGDVKVRIKRNVAGNATGAIPVPVAMHVAPAPIPMPVSAAPVTSATSASAETAAPPKEVPAEEGLHMVKSPIVGTFYESPSPGSPPFIKVGDRVTAGQVLCIVEAMKLMNEIESDASGEIVKKLVQNGQPVEYGQAMFVIRPG